MCEIIIQNVNFDDYHLHRKPNFAELVDQSKDVLAEEEKHCEQFPGRFPHLILRIISHTIILSLSPKCNCVTFWPNMFWLRSKNISKCLAATFFLISELHPPMLFESNSFKRVCPKLQRLNSKAELLMAKLESTSNKCQHSQF